MRLLGFDKQLYLESDHEQHRICWLGTQVVPVSGGGFEWVLNWHTRPRNGGDDRERTNPQTTQELFRVNLGTTDRTQAERRALLVMNTTRDIIMRVENAAGRRGLCVNLK